MNSTESYKCQFCEEGFTFYDTRVCTFKYKGETYEESLTAFWCDCCGEAIIDEHELIRSERLFHELKAKVDAEDITIDTLESNQ